MRARLAWGASAVAFMMIATPVFADQGRPRDAPAHAGLFELRLALENDNLLFGAYGRMLEDDLDGNDLGRTHGYKLDLYYDVNERGTMEFSVASALFTRSVDGHEPARMETLPIWFNELNQVRLGASVRGRGGPWRMRYGMGGDVSNREGVFALGASGQQQWWHEFNRSTLQTGLWLYDYQPDGAGLRVGGSADASAGGMTRFVFSPWSWVESEGDVVGRVGTLAGATWLELWGRVGAGLGDRHGVRFVVSIEQSVYVWVDSPGMMVRSSIDARLDFQALALQLAFSRYDGDQNARYFGYAFENVTMTFALRLRIG